VHKHFVQNHEENYGLIKRTKKSKAEGKAKNNPSREISIDTALLSERAPKMAELLTKLIDFTTKNDFDHKKLKAKLDLLSRQVSAKKERSLRPIIKSVREKILILEEIQKKVTSFNWSTLTTCPHDSPSKTTNEPLDANDKDRKIMSAPVFGFKGTEEENKAMDGAVSLNHIYSFGSISSFIALG
jgi:hypothetical protein